MTPMSAEITREGHLAEVTTRVRTGIATMHGASMAKKAVAAPRCRVQASFGRGAYLNKIPPQNSQPTRALGSVS
jgi:hypothetical protein